MHVKWMNPTLKAHGTKRLKLKYDDPLSDFAFNFSLRRYNEAGTSEGTAAAAGGQEVPEEVALPEARHLFAMLSSGEPLPGAGARGGAAGAAEGSSGEAAAGVGAGGVETSSGRGSRRGSGGSGGGRGLPSSTSQLILCHF